VATKKSKDNPHQWPDGSWHSVSWQQHLDAIQLSGHSVVSLLPSTSTQKVPSTPLTPPTLPPAQTWAESHGESTPATAQPVDPYLESARLAANRNVAISKGNAAYDTGNLGFDYGYNPDGTPNAANPYSRAALYQLDYEHQRAGTTNSLAAQGQLYSGAYGRAQGRNDRNYAMNEANNRLAYQRGLHGIQTGQLGAVASAGTGVSNADFDALLKATYPGS
jgi:hypothetical protein